MWSSNGFTLKLHLQDGKEHEAVFLDDAMISLDAYFFKSAEKESIAKEYMHDA